MKIEINNENGFDDFVVKNLAICDNKFFNNDFQEKIFEINNEKKSLSEIILILKKEKIQNNIIKMLINVEKYISLNKEDEYLKEIILSLSKTIKERTYKMLFYSSFYVNENKVGNLTPFIFYLLYKIKNLKLTKYKSKILEVELYKKKKYINKKNYKDYIKKLIEFRVDEVKNNFFPIYDKFLINKRKYKPKLEYNNTFFIKINEISDYIDSNNFNKRYIKNKKLKFWEFEIITAIKNIKKEEFVDFYKNKKLESFFDNIYVDFINYYIFIKMLEKTRTQEDILILYDLLKIMIFLKTYSVFNYKYFIINKDFVSIIMKTKKKIKKELSCILLNSINYIYKNKEDLIVSKKEYKELIKSIIIERNDKIFLKNNYIYQKIVNDNKLFILTSLILLELYPQKKVKKVLLPIIIKRKDKNIYEEEKKYYKLLQYLENKKYNKKYKNTLINILRKEKEDRYIYTYEETESIKKIENEYNIFLLD